MTAEIAVSRSATAFDRFCITVVGVLMAAKFAVFFVGSPVIEIVRGLSVFAALALCAWRIVEARRSNVVTPFLVFYGGRVAKADEPTQFMFYYLTYWAGIIGIATMAVLSVLNPGSVQWS